MMLIQLKRNIIAHKNFKWDSQADASTALEVNISAKIDEELFFQRCRQTRVILYDAKDENHKDILSLKRNENILSIGIPKATNNICKKKKHSFKKSRWMEMTDNRSNRSLSKKYPLLNSP